MKRFQLLALALTVLTFMVGATGVGAQESLIDSICLVTDIGRINDGTFNEFTYNGFARAAEEFGLDSTFIETAAPTDYDTTCRLVWMRVMDVIVTVGFLMTDKTAEFANANPDVYFIGIESVPWRCPRELVGCALP